MTALKHVIPNDGGIWKLKIGRWRLGWKVDARPGMHIRKPFPYVSRPTLGCGCWRIWIGRAFIGRKCR